MEKLNTEDGQVFVKNLASFVRTHEKALANALQLRRQPTKHAQSSHSPTSSTSSSGNAFSSTSSTLAAALSFGTLKFSSQNVRPAKLTLTPHHLYYLLSRFEDLAIAVGPMTVRLENIHTDVSQSYVSFLNRPQRSKTDKDSIHSVSSVRSVMSGMSAIWSTIGLGSKDSSAKSEKAKAAFETDLKYLYSAFTKIPCLRLAPDYRARLIRGYEEFPFETAVPLHSFKNLGALEIIDIDYRSFFGWDRLSEQLRTLTLKRANLDDPADLLTGIVLDDVDKRRRRSSSKTQQHSPVFGWAANSPPQPVQKSELSTSATRNSLSAPGSPVASPIAFGTSTSPQAASMIRIGSEGAKGHARTNSISPTRPTSSKQPSGYRHNRSNPSRIRRTGSGSSNSSENSSRARNGSTSTLALGFLPPSKWRFLRHLGLPDNSLTTITATSLAPVANTLHSLDLSSNLFVEVPDNLASLVALRALNLSNCMIESLHSLSRNPLPAITALNLRGNRLRSLAGIERLLSLERLDLRDNNLSDPTEIARLTSLPEIREIWVSGNPFVRTHSGYRVVIFNLFRRTPGYSHDIIIDGSGPGYTERKQLVDRVAEPEGAPVVRSLAADRSAVVSKPPNSVVSPAAPASGATTATITTTTLADQDEGERPPRLVKQAGEYDVGSSRRKKGSRRRIVDHSSPDKPLADGKGDSGTDVTSVLSAHQHIQLPVDPFISAPSSSSDRQRNQPDGGTQAESSSSDRRSSPEKQHPSYPSAPAAAPQVKEGNGSGSIMLKPAVQDGELYRRQLEALRQEVGNSWLTMVNDRAFDNPQKDVIVPRTGSNYTESTAMQTNSLTRTGSQAIVSGQTIS